MSDVHDRETRSRNMSQIRSRNTKPELTVRRLLFRNGYRYRLHAKELPGRPDIAFRKKKVVVFVHGCFWHMHGCKKFQMPLQNEDYWISKLEGNVRKDGKHCEVLQEAGWNVITVWECELSNPEKVMERLRQVLNKA